MIKGFREFLLRGNVVDLAVAVVIGAAFGAVVTALVADIITPIIAAIVGKPDFGNLNFTINNSHFKYGDFLNHVITFVSVAAAIYFFVVVPIQKITELRARRLAAGQDPEEAKPLSDEVALLSEIRDLLRSQA
jgi:large conductance mechanosensitive channel